MRLELVGGRYDGSTIPEREGFVFVGGLPDRPRGFHRPGRGRRLYRRAGRVFVDAERWHSWCEACEGFTVRGATCHGCGAPLALSVR